MRSENTRESSSTVGAGVDLEARLRSTQPSQIIQPQSDARLRMAGTLFFLLAATPLEASRGT